MVWKLFKTTVNRWYSHNDGTYSFSVGLQYIRLVFTHYHIIIFIPVRCIYSKNKNEYTKCLYIYHVGVCHIKHLHVQFKLKRVVILKSAHIAYHICNQFHASLRTVRGWECERIIIYKNAANILNKRTCNNNNNYFCCNTFLFFLGFYWS